MEKKLMSLLLAFAVYACTGQEPTGPTMGANTVPVPAVQSGSSNDKSARVAAFMGNTSGLSQNEKLRICGEKYVIVNGNVRDYVSNTPIRKIKAGEALGRAKKAQEQGNADDCLGEVARAFSIMN